MRLRVSSSFPSPGSHLCGLAWDGAHLWHSDGTTHRIYKMDPNSGKVLDEIPCENVRTCLGFDGEHLWQIAGTPKRIRVMDPSDGTVVREIPLQGDTEAVCALHVTPHSYWTGSKVTGAVEERDRATHRVLRAFQTGGSVHGLAVIGNLIWYTDYPAGALVAFDLEKEGEVARHPLLGQPTGLCWDGRRLWYCDYTNKRITALEID